MENSARLAFTKKLKKNKTIFSNLKKKIQKTNKK